MRRKTLSAVDLEADILKRIRASKDLSRVELARSLDLAPSTACIYVDRLIAGGFLRENEKPSRGRGRPPMMLNLHPEAGEFIGVDFEARSIMGVAVDFSDRPLRNVQLTIAETDSVAEILRKIEQAIRRIMPKDPRQLLAIGAGVPGLVNSRSGVALHYEYIAHWKNVRLAESLGKKFKVPVFIENTTRTMALAELWFGQGQGISNFLCIGIRSGIAAGLIFGGGKLFRGHDHGAGELGRWRGLPLTGKTAAWFSTGDELERTIGPELQEVASVRGIQRALKRAIAAGEQTLLKPGKGPIPIEAILRAIQQRDPLALLIVSEAAHYLGWAVSQVHHMVDPEKIILTGPLTLLGEHLLQPMRATAERLMPAAPKRNFELVNSTMGEFSGALGAAALAVDKWKPFR